MKPALSVAQMVDVEVIRLTGRLPRPRYRVKAWRVPNEDNPSVAVHMRRWFALHHFAKLEPRAVYATDSGRRWGPA